MNVKIYRYFASVMICFMPLIASMGQSSDADAYKEVAYGRAERIIANIELGENTANRQLVVTVVAEQYRDLHELHEVRDQAIQALKLKLGNDNEATLKAGIASLEKACDAEVNNLHFAYLGKLSSLLTAEQVDLIKDGMTYNVAKNTYKVYMDMIPDLNEEQNARIMAWLLEAREHAMDGGSSDEKHRWFGKYKGKINNFLSGLGYDLKQAEQDMWKRKKLEK